MKGRGRREEEKRNEKSVKEKKVESAYGCKAVYNIDTTNKIRFGTHYYCGLTVFLTVS